MELLFSPQHRAERLIATGRLYLGVFALVAIWLDPSDPAEFANIAYGLLFSYVIYSVLVAAVVVWLPSRQPPYLGLLTHLFDLVAFTLFLYFTEGPASPLYAFFVFSVLCGTLRWQWRGTLWSAVAALAAFIGLGIYAAKFINDPAFELNFFVIRSAYLVIVAVLLGYLGMHERAVRNEIYQLAAWPQTLPKTTDDLVHGLLDHAAAILKTARIVMIWEEAEEPWSQVAVWRGNDFWCGREPPGKWETLVAEPLAEKDFLCLDAGAPTPLTLVSSRQSPQGERRYGAAIDPALQKRFSMRLVLSLCLSGGAFNGRIFFLEGNHMTTDELALGAIIARQITFGLDCFFLLKRLEETAAAEERLRLAGDLHNGLFQSLTVASFKLEMGQRLLAGKPEEAKKLFAEVHDLIETEQKDLRELLGGLNPITTGPFESEFSLSGRLLSLGKKMEQQWGFRLELNSADLGRRLPRFLESEIYFIVHEALVSAARDGKASVVRVDIFAGENRVEIAVTHDGGGLPFRGRYDHSKLSPKGLRLTPLTDRITSLRGSLTVDAGDSGTRLEISVPIGVSKESDAD